MATMTRNIAIRLAFFVAAMASLLCLGARHGQAQTYGDAPWCAVLQESDESIVWDCQYRSAAECAPHVLGGIRGACNVNPYWKEASVPPAARPNRKHRVQ
jgi:hypothetical protein